MIDAKRFKDELSALLDQLYESQNENIEAAAECIAECIAKGGVVHVFGSGHSVGLGIDIKDRAAYIDALRKIRSEGTDEYLIAFFFAAATSRMESEIAQKQRNTHLGPFLF